jgi:DNA-binding MltR family transcriptional regulator
MFAKLSNKILKKILPPEKTLPEHQQTSKKNSDELIDESDRGCVLVGAAILEQRLEDIFRQQFAINQIPSKIQSDLFNSNGPLSTFSSKIKLAYSFGLIDKSVFQDLETIRKVRNEFAHTSEQVDFTNHSMSKNIEALHCVKQFDGKFQRFNLKESAKRKFETKNIPIEFQLRRLGYIKRTKSLFSLGIRTLEYQLLMSLHAIQNSSVKLTENQETSE